MTFFRYVAVQLIAYGIDLLTFLLAFEFTFFGVLASNVFGKINAGLFAYFSHRKFTFGLEGRLFDGKQAVKYFVLLGLNIPLSTLILWLVLLFIESPVVSKLIADVISVFLTFWISKKWVFIEGPNYVLTRNSKGSD